MLVIEEVIQLSTELTKTTKPCLFRSKLPFSEVQKMCKPGKTATAAIYQETISALVDLGPNIRKVELQNGKNSSHPWNFAKLWGIRGQKSPRLSPPPNTPPTQSKSASNSQLPPPPPTPFLILTLTQCDLLA